MALGWLLATGALERLLTQRIKELDKTLLTCMSVSSRSLLLHNIFVNLIMLYLRICILVFSLSLSLSLSLCVCDR